MPTDIKYGLHGILTRGGRFFGIYHPNYPIFMSNRLEQHGVDCTVAHAR